MILKTSALVIISLAVIVTIPVVCNDTNDASGASYEAGADSTAYNDPIG